MNRGNYSRRGFMQTSLAALGAAGMPLWYAREVLADIKVAKVEGVQEKLAMGIVGVGSPHSRSLGVYDASKDLKGIQWTALCDVDSRHVQRAKEFFGKEGFDCA